MVAQLLSFRWDIMPEAFLKIGSRYFLAAAIDERKMLTKEKVFHDYFSII